MVKNQLPIQLFEEWHKSAGEPEEMILSTTGLDMQPTSRVVLLRGYTNSRFVFYTNLTSKKARDLTENKKASLLFWWSQIRKQVRLEGETQIIEHSQADNYFASRPRGHQLAAWASKQSQQILYINQLTESFDKVSKEFESLEQIPRPDFWSGFEFIPAKWEFWKERANRLHDRDVYTLDKSGNWQCQKLFP